MMSLPAARALELVKTYGSGDTLVHALAGVTVEFEAGAFTAIMGPLVCSAPPSSVSCSRSSCCA
jgi:hypothetical protein